MPYEQKNDSGSLFRNDRKKTEKHPDYTGQAIIGGVEYWISAWINKSPRTGNTYMSLSFNEKEDQEQTTPRQDLEGVGSTRTRKSEPLADDDIPF